MKKEIWIVIAAIALTVLAMMLLKKCGKQPDIIAAKDSTQYYHNKLNQEVAAIKQREQDYNKAAAGYLDSIANLHNTKAKLIEEIAVLTQKGKVVINEPGDPTVIYIDTGSTKLIPGKIPDYVQQTFHNPWYEASVVIPVAAKDSSSLLLSTSDTLRVVAKTVKEGSLFNRQTYLQIDAVNSNPFNHISGLQVYRKPLPKPKKVGIGLQAGCGFSNSLTPSVYIGVGISYNIIRL